VYLAEELSLIRTQGRRRGRTGPPFRRLDRRDPFISDFELMPEGGVVKLDAELPGVFPMGDHFDEAEELDRRSSGDCE
jgi:hypothetical protein